MASRYPWFVRRDLDGFFGLFTDNLVQLLVISALGIVAGLSQEFVFRRILPGAALSVLIGNFYYSWQARRVAIATGRDDITALPYGINTPSVFAFLFFVMKPVYDQYKPSLGDDAAALRAWQIGLVACMGSALIEFGGAFIAERVRRATPRAALLCALAGVAIGFISMEFTLQVFEHPLLALLPASIILMQYFSGVRLPLGLPAGLTAILVGTALAWGLRGLDAMGAFSHFGPLVGDQLKLELAGLSTGDQVKAAMHFTWLPPVLSVGDLIAGFRQPEIVKALGIVVPMGLFNVIGSLQNIESAEAAGDPFPAGPSLAVNGLCSMLACCFGSCFPTTIYIGHPGWKRLGARTGYSALNGIALTVLCMAGIIRVFQTLVPTVAIVGILIWVAIIIGAQAFQAIPRRHAPAVVLGLFPALAAWGLLVVQNSLQVVGTSIGGVGLAKFGETLRVGGLIGLDHGFIITSMGWAAIGVYLIDRKFRAAAAWALILGALAFPGLIHAWSPTSLDDPATIGWGVGWRYTVPYFLMALMLWALAPQAARMPPPSDDDDAAAPPGHG